MLQDQLSSLDRLVEQGLTSLTAVAGHQGIASGDKTTEEKLKSLRNAQDALLEESTSSMQRQAQLHKDEVEKLCRQLLCKSTQASALEKQVVDLNAQLVVQASKISDLERRKRSVG